MKIKHALTASMLSVILSAGTAIASDPIPASGDHFVIFSEVGGWTTYSDGEAGSCLIERVDENGNVVQMGLTKNHKHGYIGVFTLADIDIKNRQKIELSIDGYVFEGRAHGIKSKKLKGNYSGGYLVAKDPNMATAIAEGQTLVAFPKKTAAFTVDLTGTKNAMEEGRKCNLSMS